MIRIAIWGQKENGKTTAANIIRNKIFPHLNIPVVSFAQPLYETFSFLTGLPVSFLRENKNKIPVGCKQKIREGLQGLGKIARQFKPDIFIQKLIESNSGNFIVDDGRLEEECEPIKKLGGIRILIIRPSHINNDPDETESWLGSIYKQMKPDPYIKTLKFPLNTLQYINKYFDEIIVNDGTVKDLENTIARIFDKTNNSKENI